MKDRVVLPLFALLAWLIIPSGAGAGPRDYPKTIETLKELYRGEILAHRTYLAYAEKARAENHPNIAHLFLSFAASEAIHARNFKKHLIELGARPVAVDQEPIEVRSTKKNLRTACDVELKEIDSHYPRYVETVKPEGYTPVIQDIVYAWKTERQHRDLIRKIRRGTGFLFGALVRMIEKSPNRFFICQRCGSTLTELPEGPCPICSSPAKSYKEIMGIERDAASERKVLSSHREGEALFFSAVIRKRPFLNRLPDLSP